MKASLNEKLELFALAVGWLNGVLADEAARDAIRRRLEAGGPLPGWTRRVRDDLSDVLPEGPIRIGLAGDP